MPGSITLDPFDVLRTERVRNCITWQTVMSLFPDKVSIAVTSTNIDTGCFFVGDDAHTSGRDGHQ